MGYFLNSWYPSRFKPVVKHFQRERPSFYLFTGLQKTAKFWFEFNWIVINNLLSAINNQQFPHMGYYQQMILLYYFHQEISQEKTSFLEGIFFFKFFFSYHPENLVVAYTFTFCLPWISWIYDSTTQTPQIHCCTNYKWYCMLLTFWKI